MSGRFEVFLVCGLDHRECCPLLLDQHIEGTSDKALMVFGSRELALAHSDSVENTVIVQFRSPLTLATFFEHYRDNEDIQRVAIDPPPPTTRQLVIGKQLYKPEPRGEAISLYDIDEFIGRLRHGSGDDHRL